MLTIEAEARFWRKVNKDGPTIREELGPCWIWTAGKITEGYGLFCVAPRPNKRMMVAHRVSWSLLHGEPGPEVKLLHGCDNPSCVNPGHLTPGTQLDNMRDKVSKQRQAKRETHGRAKLTESQVSEMKLAFASGETRLAIASRFGISHSQTCKILKGRVWA